MSDNNTTNSDWAPVGELQNRVELKTSSKVMLGLLALAAIIIAFGVYVILNDDGGTVRIRRVGRFSEWLGGRLLVSIGVAAALSSLFFILKPNRFTLNRDGFDYTGLRGSGSERWTELSEFALREHQIDRKNNTYTVVYSKLDAQGNPTDLQAIKETYGMKHDAFLKLLNDFRDRAVEASGNPDLAKASLTNTSDTTDSWTPGVLDDDDSYKVAQERAPWLKWGLGGLLLSMVAAGAIYLGSIWFFDNAPETKIEFPTGTASSVDDPNNPKEPPKSADDLAWVEALEKDTLQGYKNYIEAFPEGRYVDKAQAEIDVYDDEAWATAQERNTIIGYEDYLAEWPEGKYAPKAQEIIDQMKKAIEAQKKDAAERAERERQEALARAARERTAWSTAEAANSVDSYQTYLASHPSGKNAPEAQARINRFLGDAATAQANAIEQQAWNSAKANNTAESYQTYLASYPNGAYSPLAKAALEELRPSPGKTFQDCNVCPMMKTLDSGNAQLGASASEPGVKPNELPKRPVIISTPFSVSLTEVTFAQWDACATDGGCTARPNDNGWGRGNRPVINISWDDAQGYAQWLSNKTGKKYSLPSEAQWEYAARGGETGHYMGGSEAALCAFANGAGTESGLTWANKNCSDLSSDRTLPAGSLSSNKYGLKDMLGNVQEWVLDCNTLNLKDAPTNGEPDLRGSCNQRVVRGGSWFSPPTGLRFSARENQRRGDSNDFTGFRVVRN